MFSFLFLSLLVTTFTPVLALGPPPNSIHNLVTFGDSYTDIVSVGDGGTAWPVYLASPEYANLTLYPFAKSGAVCDQRLTPRPFPGVVQDEVPAFLEGRANGSVGGTGEDTLVTIWIGTNDVGPNTLLTGGQINNVTIVDTTSCAVNVLQTLYNNGSRNFLFQNMLPFELLVLYQVDSYPNRFWTAPRNTTSWNLFVRELAVSGNEIARLMLKSLAIDLADAHIGLFDSHTLFGDIVSSPSSFLNGTSPNGFNTTGCVHSCVFQLNESTSDSGACTLVNGTDRDSYVWFDELHPSEQSDRIVAREIKDALSGAGSKYVTWFS